jgi:hypothetical protein
MRLRRTWRTALFSGGSPSMPGRLAGPGGAATNLPQGLDRRPLGWIKATGGLSAGGPPPPLAPKGPHTPRTAKRSKGNRTVVL